MNFYDWLIIITYLAGIVLLSVYIGRNHTTQADYYVGGRNIPWWAIGISTMATQTSAISFISKPAFVALKPGGGLTWLQYELAVPLSMIVVMVVLIPLFRKLELVSVYEYLEMRFGPSIRYLVSGVFLISRGVAAGVVVYATAIVLSACLEIELWQTILIIGVVTIVYDVIGGMPAVVYSDVIQMFVLVAGIILCIYFAVDQVGGFAAIFGTLPAERLHVIDWSPGLGDGSDTPFWGFLIGGFFLFISYYGTDQSQVQRELSAESVEGTRRSLLINGFSRFPLGMLYIVLGMAVGAVYQISPELQKAVPAENLDYLVPQYILIHLPHGIKALLFAALMAATMSSLDSVLNSLSAATMRDFVSPFSSIKADDLRAGQWVTVIWGIVITFFAFYSDQISDTIVEAINKIGSAFYGPILAAFLAGILMRKANTRGVFWGIISGVAFNGFVWVFYSGVYWMWWNAFGLVVTMTVTWLISTIKPIESGNPPAKLMLTWKEILENERRWVKAYLALILYFAIILSAMLWFQWSLA